MDLGLTGRRALVLGSTGGLGLAVATVPANEACPGGAVWGRRGERARGVAAGLPGARLGSRSTRPCDGVDGCGSATRRPRSGLSTSSRSTPADPRRAAPSTEHVRCPRGGRDSAAATDRVGRGRPAGTPLSWGWGLILAIGSSGVQAPLPGLVLSNIGRAGLAGYLKTLASEVAADGVTVEAAPRRFEHPTAPPPSTAGERRRACRSRRSATSPSAPSPLHATGPREFGAVAAFLCSGPASYLTGGEQVRCDGGYVASY